MLDEKITGSALLLQKRDQWFGLIKFFLGTFAVSIVSLWINYQIQQRQIEIKELDSLGAFVTHAIADDADTRKRFASYFSTVLTTEDARGRWRNYHASIEAVENELIELDRKIKQADKQSEEYQQLQRRKERIERSLGADYVSERDKQELGKNVPNYGGGQLMFAIAGNEKRVVGATLSPHVKSKSSGVVIGRGYDLRYRTASEVAQDLTVAGFDPDEVKAFVGAVGLAGIHAREYVQRELREIQISPDKQLALFEIVAQELVQDLKRIFSKADVVALYGEVDVDELDVAIIEVLIDMRSRGDYTGSTRRKLQSVIAKNDLAGFAAILADESYWMQQYGVPKAIFDERNLLLQRALESR